MSIKRISSAVLPIVLIGAVGMWFYLTPGWSGQPRSQQQVDKATQLYITRYQKRGVEDVLVHCFVIDPEHSSFNIVSQYETEETSPDDLKGLAIKQNAGVMINGGYFDHNFLPVGLLVRNGIEESPVSDQAALSGIVAINKAQGIELDMREAWPIENTTAAIQAGPFLIDPGGKPGIYSEDFKRAKRSAIGKTQSGSIVFLATSPCTLYELSQILYQDPGAIGVSRFDRVLNLDGGPSSGVVVADRPTLNQIPESNVPNAIYLEANTK